MQTSDPNPLNATAEDLRRRAAELTADGRSGEAIEPLRQACALDPDHPESWSALFAHITATGNSEDARQVQAGYLRSLAQGTLLKNAAEALAAGRIPESYFLAQTWLRTHPEDALALRLLGEAAFWQANDADSVRWLRECLRLQPTFPGCRFRFAVALYRSSQVTEAREEVARILEETPRDTSARFLMATILAQTGEDAKSAEIYATLVREYPLSVSLWMSYGNVLKTSGNQTEALAAYRRIIELDPNSGMAWWSLSNFKTVRFSQEDREAMKARVESPEVTAEQRLHFQFALGKACEDNEDFRNAFFHYAEGNRLRLAETGYDPTPISAHVASCRKTLTREFFDARRDRGLSDASPIFVVGLPRSGSTLIEQILSSHSQVEGTAELPYMSVLVRREFGGAEGESADLNERLALLDETGLKSLARRYLDAAAVHRVTDRPFFIDKALNNFFNIGIIQLILPNAKIIDARRHPLGCGFSNFKQLFVRGQLFSYSLQGIGQYYRDYVGLMAHFDEVLPGRVHRVIYERMVQDTEGEVRRLLEHCGLPFEESCLAFHQNRRAVRTVSSEQVRRPIYTEGMDHWRNFEPWLGELKQTLGSVLEKYPEVPDDLRRA